MRVLMVEDDALDAEILEISLARDSEQAHDITRVETLGKALERLEDDQYDVVLLDINLPDAVGPDPVRQVALSRNGAPVVVVSGKDDEAFAVDMIRAGAQDYVVKGSEAYRNLGRTMRYAVERKESEKQLKQLASFDPLTNLANRQEMCLQLTKACAHADRHGDMVGVFVIDLDNFKLVNDKYGHTAGDQLLKKLAEEIEGAIRAGDTAARLGGDEFCVLLEGIHSASAAQTWADNCLKRINRFVKEHGLGLPLSASIGGVVYPADGHAVDELLRNADLAMYKAKRDGRNSVSFYNERMDRIFTQQQELENELKLAIENSTLHPVFQPKIEIATGKVVGLEALCRWMRKDGSSVSPGEFLPIAQTQWQMLAIGRLMRQQVFAFIDHWTSAGFDLLPVSVNVDGQELGTEGFGEDFVNELERWRLPARAVRVEITETTLVEETEIVRENLYALRHGGIGIELDDFGAGHSSLNYLRQFTIDTIKIDRSLVAEVGVNQQAATILAAVFKLASDLGLKTVAEGVESSQQLRMVTELGADFAQGYLIARPMAGEEVRRWMGRYSERQKSRLESMTGKFRIMSDVDLELMDTKDEKH